MKESMNYGRRNQRVEAEGDERRVEREGTY